MIDFSLISILEALDDVKVRGQKDSSDTGFRAKFNIPNR